VSRETRHRDRSPNTARVTSGPLRGISPAAMLAAVGLVVVGAISFGLLGGPVPNLGLVGSKTANGGVPNRTPDPIIVFQPEQRPTIKGTILFAKAGNIWSVSNDDQLRQITATGHDSSPVWSPDGTAIYFLQTKTTTTQVPCSLMPEACPAGTVSNFTLEYPVLSKMAANGTQTVAIKDGLYSLGSGQGQYFYGIYQPALNPAGSMFAVVSDGPDPFSSDYVIQFLPATGGKLTRPAIPEDYGLGQNDPAWSPDGKTVAFTYNHREGTSGRPRIGLYTPATKRTRFLTDFGYAQPDYAPGGKYLAAVRTSAKGRDVVILNAVTGVEVLRLTNDGRSFAPVWSPAGDQIAFLRASGTSIDLNVATIAAHGGAFTLTKQEPLTTQSQIDGASKPSWFVPADQLPTPAPTATPMPPAAAATAAASQPSTGP
jgi:dipeptidyl aminopeptidase/acylaminoacyl peptidase